MSLFFLQIILHICVHEYKYRCAVWCFRVYRNTEITPSLTRCLLSEWLKNKNPLLFYYETFSLLWTQGQTDCECLDSSIQSSSLFPKLVQIDFVHSKTVLLSPSYK